MITAWPPSRTRRRWWSATATSSGSSAAPGATAVWRLVRDEGLGRFYDERDWEAPGLPAAARPGAAPLADLSAYRPVVAADGTAEVDVAIDGIRCASCVWLNERVLQRTPGVLAARVNYATHRARIRYAPGAIALPAVLARVQAAGYVPLPWRESEQARARDAEVRDLLVRVGTAWFLASQLMIYSAALYAGYFQGMDRPTRTLLEWISDRPGRAGPALGRRAVLALRARTGCATAASTWTRWWCSGRAPRWPSRSGRRCAAARSGATPPP